MIGHPLHVPSSLVVGPSFPAPPPPLLAGSLAAVDDGPPEDIVPQHTEPTGQQLGSPFSSQAQRLSAGQHHQGSPVPEHCREVVEGQMRVPVGSGVAG